MKTKFFKKLSFVLVAAMVLSLFVPAAGAFAASSIKLNSTNKYLHLGRDNANEYNFNILSKKGKGWQYYWESSNEKVAVVKETNGVTTAVGAGTATIKLTITDKDGELVDTAKAKVTVRDNITEVTINNGPEGDKLAVGEPYDFNRSYVTEAGKTTGSKAVTRWTVEPSDTAEIDDKGVFVATEAGEYTIVARSFQSLARYNNWKNDPEAYADDVTAVSEAKVITVVGSIEKVKQTGLSSVDVYFDSPVADADKNLSVHQIVGTTAVKQLVKEVKLSDDKKVASVTMYVPFTTGADYRVDYTGMDSEPFTAATTKWEDVAALKITTSQATINKATEVEFELLNADGTVINTPELEARVDMTSKGEVGTFFDGKNITIFNKDSFATITAIFHTYKYDNVGNELGAITITAIVYGVEEAATNITGLNSWTIVKANDSNEFEPKFDDTKTQIAVGDAGYRLFVEFLTSDKDVKKNSKDDFDKFDYTSSDKNKLIIDQLGNLYPVASGDVVIVVLYGDAGSRTPIGAVPVTISAKRAVATFTLDKYSVVLSNSSDLDRTADVKIELKDQLGGDVTYNNIIKVEKLAGPDQAVGVDEPTEVGPNVAVTDDKIVFSGAGRAAGEYQFKVTVKDKVAVITVTIQDGSGGVTYNKLVLGATSVDVKADKDNKGNIDLTIEVIGHNNKGVEAKNQPLTGNTLGSFKVVVDAPSNYSLGGFDPLDENKYLLSTATSGNAVTKAPTGNYKVTAFEMKSVNDVLTWVPIEVLYFSVTDSQVKPVLAEVKTRIFAQDLSGVTFGDDVVDPLFKDIVKASLKFTLDGNEIDTIQSVDVFGTTSEFNIKAVTIRETIAGGAYIDHKVNVGLTVAKSN